MKHWLSLLALAPSLAYGEPAADAVVVYYNGTADGAGNLVNQAPAYPTISAAVQGAPSIESFTDVNGMTEPQAMLVDANNNYIADYSGRWGRMEIQGSTVDVQGVVRSGGAGYPAAAYAGTVATGFSPIPDSTWVWEIYTWNLDTQVWTITLTGNSTAYYDVSGITGAGDVTASATQLYLAYGSPMFYLAKVALWTRDLTPTEISQLLTK